MANKYVYLFGTRKSDGDKEMRNLLGGKGANLAEMARLGLPVPAGFTLTTEVCTYYYDHQQSYPASSTARSTRPLAKSKRRWAPNSATRKTPSCSQSAPVPASRCRG